MAKKFRSLNSREKTFAILVLAAFLVGAWLPERLIVATSGSLDHRIFFLTRTKESVEKGDYLVFRHNDSRFIQNGLNPDNDRLIKKVACNPGDLFSMDAENNFFCNRTMLGEALVADSKGRALPLFQYFGAVPESSYFMMGTDPRSYDSRYFGFVHEQDILYKALPIW